MDRNERDLVFTDVRQWKPFRSSCPDTYRLVLEFSSRELHAAAAEFPTDVARAAGSHGIELEGACQNTVPIAQYQ